MLSINQFPFQIEDLAKYGMAYPSTPLPPQVSVSTIAKQLLRKQLQGFMESNV